MSDPMYISRTDLPEAFEYAVSALENAHELIADHISGRPWNFNSLENYFNDVRGLQRLFEDCEGGLIGPFLRDLQENVTFRKSAAPTNPPTPPEQHDPKKEIG